RISPKNLEVSATAVLDHIKATFPDRPIHLIGHSLGGFVATQLALRSPDPIEAVTLFSPAGAKIDYTEHCQFTDHLIHSFERPVEGPNPFSIPSWYQYFQRICTQERWQENPEFRNFLLDGKSTDIF